MNRSPTFPVRACLFYNRLFRFRATHDTTIRDMVAAETRRNRDPYAEALRYAEAEYAKAGAFLAKFDGIAVAGRRVLDFGCRYGGSSLWYADQGAAGVIGVDLTDDMLETAREFVRHKSQSAAGNNHVLLAPIEFRQSGHDSIPVGDGEIDLILSEDVVEHLQNPAAIFREWWRVLAPGGKVVLSFGPLWYHPHGVHLWEVFPAPWTHVLFSERTCVRARNILKAEPDTGEDRWTDMNKMTLRRFEWLVRESPFTCRLMRTHAVWGMKPLLALPGVREFFASGVECVLEKAQSADCAD